MTDQAAWIDDEQRVLARRAERLKQIPADDDGVAQTWIAEFPVGDRLCGLPLIQIRACVPCRMVTPVPTADASVIGILRFEGTIVTAVSLASMLGVRGWRVDPAVLLVVMLSPRALVAVDCEAIPRATTIPEAVVEAARSRAPGPILEIRTPDISLDYIESVDKIIRRRPESSG